MALELDGTDEIKLFGKWSYEDIKAADISLEVRCAGHLEVKWSVC